MKRNLSIKMGIILLAISMLSMTACKKNNDEGQASASGNVYIGGRVEDLSEEDIPAEELLVPVNEEDYNLEAAIQSKIKVKKSTWDSCCFRLDGNVYQLPFSYHRISEDYSFNPLEYGMTEDFMLEPGIYTSDNIELINDKHDFIVTIGLYNPYKEPVSIDQAMVYSISFVLNEDGSGKGLTLPGGVSFNESLALITASFGIPTIPFSHDLETDIFTYQYSLDSSRFMEALIQADKGLISISMKKYN